MAEITGGETGVSITIADGSLAEIAAGGDPVVVNSSALSDWAISKFSVAPSNANGGHVVEIGGDGVAASDTLHGFEMPLTGEGTVGKLESSILTIVVDWRVDVRGEKVVDFFLQPSFSCIHFGRYVVAGTSRSWRV